MLHRGSADSSLTSRLVDAHVALEKALDSLFHLGRQPMGRALLVPLA
jgi:hypothetical protein